MQHPVTAIKYNFKNGYSIQSVNHPPVYQLLRYNLLKSINDLTVHMGLIVNKIYLPFPITSYLTNIYASAALENVKRRMDRNYPMVLR